MFTWNLEVFGASTAGTACKSATMFATTSAVQMSSCEYELIPQSSQVA